MHQEKGQSLIEIIITMGIFVIIVTAVAYVVLNSYATERLSREITRASFLAYEGMEAARSIRDNNWDDLVSGQYGLIMSGSQWILQGTQDDISSQLRDGTRKIIIEEIDDYRKRVSTVVQWNFREDLSQEVNYVTHFTNWSTVSVINSCPDYCLDQGYGDGFCRQNPVQCSRAGGVHEPGGDGYCTAGSAEDTCCCLP